MTTAAQVPRLDNSFGALYIGMVVSSALWGISTAQIYWYYVTYDQDTLWLKIYVALAWLWDTTHQMMVVHSLYYYLVTNYFNPVNLNHHVWSFIYQVFFEALTCVFVQGFFVYRIWILSRRKWCLIVLPSLFVVAKFSMSLTYVVEAAQIRYISVVLVKVHKLSASLNGLAAGGDIAIAITMAVLLYRSRSGFARSDGMVLKLMTYTVNTGIITSVGALTTLVLALALPGGPIYGSVYFVTAKLYLNTMMGSLNARNNIARTAPAAAVTGAPQFMSSGSYHTRAETYAQPKDIESGSGPESEMETFKDKEREEDMTGHDVATHEAPSARMSEDSLSIHAL